MDTIVSAHHSTQDHIVEVIATFLNMNRSRLISQIKEKMCNRDLKGGEFFNFFTLQNMAIDGC